jgi:hypothetical protein
VLKPHWLQASHSLAENLAAQASQLAAGCVSLLEALLGRNAWSPESAWLVLRPVLRLLLWLLPEHASNGKHPTAAAQMTQSSAQKTANSRQERVTAAAVASEGWQAMLSRSYLSSVATVSMGGGTWLGCHSLYLRRTQSAFLDLGWTWVQKVSSRI